MKSEDISPEDPEQIFEMIELIGEGSFGLVCTCRNLHENKIYAIKFLDVEEDDHDGLQREIEILKEASECNNIVKYYGCYKKENTYMIVMEYCEGGSAQDIMKLCHHTLTEDQLQVICLHILKGLKYLHSHHIMHRDLKAGNILLSADGEAKLADFGVSAKLLSTNQKKKSVLGSAYWMAPEVISVQKDSEGYDIKADIWSLGITVIELAEGKPPLFDISSLRAIFLIPIREPPTLKEPQKWSPELSDFISKCLKKDPSQRAVVNELLHHPFVTKGKGKENLLRDLVRECIPILSIERKKKQEKAKEDGVTEEYPPGTTITVNGANTTATIKLSNDGTSSAFIQVQSSMEEESSTTGTVILS